MKYLIILGILILFVFPIHAQQEPTLGECIQDWQFVNAKHQRLHDTLNDLPVTNIWIGYNNYSEYGQEGINAPLFSEMRQVYWILANNGEQVALAFYTHPITPETVYIFPIRVVVDNHGVCPFYSASKQDVRKSGVLW